MRWFIVLFLICFKCYAGTNTDYDWQYFEAKWQHISHFGKKLHRIHREDFLIDYPMFNNWWIKPIKPETMARLITVYYFAKQKKKRREAERKNKLYGLEEIESKNSGVYEEHIEALNKDLTKLYADYYYR